MNSKTQDELPETTEGTPKPEPPSPRKHRIVTGPNPVNLAGCLILLLLAGLLAVGFANRYNLLPRVTRLVGDKDSITLVSANAAGAEPTILMVVRRNGHSEVRALSALNGAQSFFSAPNAQSSVPVQSPVGDRVAYLVENPKGQFAVKVGVPNGVVTDTISKDTLNNIKRTGLELCDPTQIAWSTDGQKLAAFVCNKQSKESYVLVTEAGGLNQILDQTKDNLDRARSIVWVSPTRVVYTQNENNLDAVYVLDVNNPDKPDRIFGP